MGSTSADACVFVRSRERSQGALRLKRATGWEKPVTPVRIKSYESDESGTFLFSWRKKVFPGEPPPARLHAHRAAGGDCHHRDPGRDAAAGPEPGQGDRAPHFLHE